MTKETVCKNDIINKIAQKTEMTKKSINIVLSEYEEAVKNEINDGNVVRISGLGIFEKKLKKGREGIITVGVSRGKSFKTKDSFDVKFSCAKAFKDRINGD